jgi:hypothetical protein
MTNSRFLRIRDGFSAIILAKLSISAHDADLVADLTQTGRRHYADVTQTWLQTTTQTGSDLQAPGTAQRALSIDDMAKMHHPAESLSRPLASIFGIAQKHVFPQGFG